jgi:hypothetical protein
MSETWFNPDGLLVKFGRTQGEPGTAGGYAFPADGSQSVIELDLTLTDVVSTAGTILDGVDNIVIPNRARIEAVEVRAETGAAGSGAVLNLGLIKTDRSTELDFNGLLAALPQTSVATAGQTVVYDYANSYGGNLLGTTLTANGILVADYDTAAFTDGVLHIKIFYTMDSNRDPVNHD